MSHQDTIAAIATPFGTSGIGIIRISGPESLTVARRIFKPSGGKCLWKSHRLYHGDIVSIDGETVLDEVLISCMHKPRSFTGEDVVEINCHGNPIIIQSILTQLQDLGCRLARPGEFSERAFLNNRLDLTQAEALSVMICAKSAKTVALGLAQMKGSLSREIKDLRLLLIDAMSQLETAIDFSEDTTQERIPLIPPQMNQAMEKAKRLFSSYDFARPYTEGINVIITGKPNVGKSSLMNALTGRKKAIVTEIPGTTRDLITDAISIAGITVHLTDTAGIREPQNAIEKEGISLVWENIADADVVIVMLDISRPISNEDRLIIGKNTAGKIITAINKIDLPHTWTIHAIKPLFPPDTKILEISAKTGAGLEELKQAITALSVSAAEKDEDSAMIINLRHRQALEKALQNIQTALQSLTAGLSPEFAAFDLREAIDHLDAITGQKITDEILDKIFSSFCIGK